MNLTKHTPGRVTIATKIKRAWWNIICTLFFKPFITKIFRKWRIAILKIFGAKIEWDAEVYSSVKYGLLGISKWDIVPA